MCGVLLILPMRRPVVCSPISLWLGLLRIIVLRVIGIPTVRSTNFQFSSILLVPATTATHTLPTTRKKRIRVTKIGKILINPFILIL